MINDLKNLFLNMGIVSIVLIGVGLLTIAVLAFIPKKFWISIIGFGLVIGGIVGRIISGANIMQSIYLILICLIVILPFMIIEHKVSKKYEFIKKVQNAQTDVTVPINASLNNVSLEILKNKTATAFTDLKPIGKIKVDGEIFEAKTEGEFVRVGEKVKIVKIDKDNIMFVKSKKKKN